MDQSRLERAYEMARERYALLGVDADRAVTALESVPISLHCWQGDDVAGFETPDAELSGGGLQVTGNYPGKARDLEDLRADLAKAFALIPGRHRLNLHAIYGDFGGVRIERDGIEPRYYQSWVQWARAHNLGIDFNATCFGHPRAGSGYTLASLDDSTRNFWIEHVTRCREIAAWIGQELGAPCIHNLWIPDGSKDAPVSRYQHRDALLKALDRIFSVSFPARQLKDAVESKLFGLGSESYVAGSHEFYLLWAKTNGKMVCIDMGHFHPTESVADKVSALLLFFDEILFHVSRGVRWDSDHVVVVNDELRALMEEIVRAGALARVHLALDYFDAELNRIGAWVLGARATQKALLIALLEPTAMLRACETAGDFCGRLAVLEEIKSLPFGAVWDYFCARMGVPTGVEWLTEIRNYELNVLSKRCGRPA
jgi:L-rhamnose isomerase